MCWCENVIHGCNVPLLLADWEVPSSADGANNNEGGEFVKKADNPVVNVKGNNNRVDVKITVIETPSKTPAAIVIAITVIVVVSVLAVSLCCPDLLADFVRWIVSLASGS